MAEFSVEGKGMRFWVTVDGTQVEGPYGSAWAAEEARDALARRAHMRERPCLRCKTPFMSEGAHHRMCTRCRQTAHDIYQGAV